MLMNSGYRKIFATYQIVSWFYRTFSSDVCYSGANFCRNSIPVCINRRNWLISALTLFMLWVVRWVKQHRFVQLFATSPLVFLPPPFLDLFSDGNGSDLVIELVWCSILITLHFEVNCDELFFFYVSSRWGWTYAVYLFYYCKLAFRGPYRLMHFIFTLLYLQMNEPTNVDSTYWNSPEPLARQRPTATSIHAPTQCEGADVSFSSASSSFFLIYYHFPGYPHSCGTCRHEMILPFIFLSTVWLTFEVSKFGID